MTKKQKVEVIEVSEEERSTLVANIRDMMDQVPDDLQIESDEQNVRWGEFVRDVLDPLRDQGIELYASVTEKQKLAVAAAKDALSETRRQQEKIVGPIERARVAIRAAMGAWDQRKRAAQKRIQARIDEAARDRGKPAPPPVKPAAEQAAGVSTRLNWKCEVVDPSAVNPEFLVPDLRKLGRVVRTMGEDAQPIVGEGVRIWSESIVAVGKA